MMTYAYRVLDPMMWIVGVGAVALWRLSGDSNAEHVSFHVLLSVWFALLILSLPVAGRLCYLLVNRHHPPMFVRPPEVDCIVVLGGGIQRAVDGTAVSQLEESTIRRCLRASELYRQGPPCPVILCGGNRRPAECPSTDAAVMRELMLRLGVANHDVLMEDSSRSTWENSLGARKLMEPRGLKCPAVVTDALHLGRAMWCFQAQGIDARAAGCHYVNRARPLTLLNFLPSSTAPAEKLAIVHELVKRAFFSFSCSSERSPARPEKRTNDRISAGGPPVALG